MIAEMETIFSHPSKVSDRYITADGYRTHYLEAGDEKAEPLVLVHGSSSFGVGVDRWYPTVIPLSEEYRVIAVDELGYGETDAPRDLDDLGTPMVRAEHLIAFIEALNIGPVHLLGQSEGGWIAAYIALKRPEMVKKLILVDSGSAAAAPKYYPYFDNVFVPGTMLPKDDLGTSEALRNFETQFVYFPSRITDEYMERVMAKAAKWQERHQAKWTKFWTAEDAWEKKARYYDLDGAHLSESLGKLSMPTLVMWGRQSAKGADRGYEFYKKIPNAQFHVFDKANHFAWLDQANDFNTHVLWYLSKSEPEES